MTKILQFILATLTFLLLTGGTLWFISFNSTFYLQEFEKYSLYSQFNQDQTFINNQFQSALDYLQGKTKSLDSSFYNSKEKQHLEDVKHLYSLLKIILLSSYFLFLFFTYLLLLHKKYFLYLQGIFFGALFSFLFTLLLALLSLLNFQTTFILFHKLLFNNTLWILNPETDNLIKLLPLELFIDLTKKLLSFLLLSSIFLLLGISLLKKQLKAFPQNLQE